MNSLIETKDKMKQAATIFCRSLQGIFAHMLVSMAVRFNPVKCKMFIDFLHHKPHHPPPLQLSGSEIERVHTYKLLGPVCMLLIIYAGARTTSTLFRERANA